MFIKISKKKHTRVYETWKKNREIFEKWTVREQKKKCILKCLNESIDLSTLTLETEVN